MTSDLHERAQWHMESPKCSDYVDKAGADTTGGAVESL